MSGKTKIYFRGNLYIGYKDLIDSWEKRYPSEFPIHPRSLAQNLNKWKKKNPNKNLPDEIIKKYLVSRQSKNSITYKGITYSGPKKLFISLEKLPKISYTGFHLNFQQWKSENPNKQPNESEVEFLVDNKRVKTEDGRRLSPDRYKWEKLPIPKISWSLFHRKLNDFELSEFRKPSHSEFKDLALPDSEWLDDRGSTKYRKSNGWLISREEFYNLQEIKEISFGGWAKRITNQHERTGSRVTPEIAIKLIKSWGVAERSVGILYRWTNIDNGMIYIGITTETLKERIRGHLRKVKVGRYNSNSLQSSIANEGIEAFHIEELERFEDLGDLAKAEKKSILEHDCVFPKGYNLDSGGKGVGLRKIPIEFRGIFYKNMVALANNYDMPEKRLESRLRLGWTLDEAVDIPKGFQKDKGYFKVTDGQNIHELAEKHGITIEKVYARLGYGWTFEEALGIIKREPVGGKAKAVKVNGISFRSHRKAAEYFGVTESAWRKRLKLGWSIEEAAELIPRTNRKK
tara:strand:+ start:803 stop:2347 length:1545 start_codon:yes stop_codon:yes gene_type:complete